MGATVNFFRHERRLGRTGTGFWINLAIAGQVISFAFLAHLIEIALWAGLFVVCGEFQEFGPAYYHSAAGATGRCRGSAHVRRFNRNDFCCHPKAHSCSVRGPQELILNRSSPAEPALSLSNGDGSNLAQDAVLGKNSSDEKSRRDDWKLPGADPQSTSF